MGDHGRHLLFQRVAGGLTDEGVAVLDCRDRRLRKVAGAGAVDKRAGKVADFLAVEEHSHTAGVGNVGDMGHLNVIGRAELHKALFIGRFDNDCHALLGLAYRELCSIEARVFDGDTVEVNIEAGCELAYGYAHAASAEVVGFLDEARDLWAAEQTLELTLLGGVALLDLRTAGFERGFGVLLGGTGCAAYSVAAGASAQQEDYIARDGTLAAHVVRLDGAYYRSDFHTLGGIAVGIDFPDVGGCKADLVSVAGIAARGLARYHALRELAGDSVGDLGCNVARAGDAHRLIDVRAAG